MTLSLANAIVYDIETFPNCMTLAFECLNSDQYGVFEISDQRDDRAQLIQWFNWLQQTQTPMIGFNSLHFDYNVIHEFFMNPKITYGQLYDKAMSVINSKSRFPPSVPAWERFTPQIDLYKVYHMDNPAKSTSLKALQINMRTDSVEDMPVEVGTTLLSDQIDRLLVPYNKHDVQETKKFAQYSLDALNYRIGLIEQFGVEVMNWADTKIGSEMMEARLGKELCYTFVNGKKEKRQTPRTRIALGEIIFPYIKFDNPEFKRIHEYLQRQVLTPAEISEFNPESKPKVQTKGVFTDLTAHVGGIDFYFGTGGIHGSVSSQRIMATDEWLIRDIDVASLYPSIAIVNKLAPAHLGEAFVNVYSELPKERKRWQESHGKKCSQANTLKLASNGVYGNSNNEYSVFYDPQFTLTITVNGQLMLCMLAEKLVTIPTLRIIQVNTDGITYYIHKDYEPLAAQACKEWETLTKLKLEDADYSRMFIRDVNNYIAESKKDGSLKLKGAYWTPNPLNYYADISAQQPPAWHKDLSNLVSTRAAVAAMVHGIEPETFIRLTTNPYDFMCRAKVNKSDQLLHGNKEIQRTSRYYISTDGDTLIKRMPPKGPAGAYCKANGITENEYLKVMNEVNWQWDARVCTKNRSRYDIRETNIQAGYKTTICNHIRDFSFYNVNYEWYIQEARKLIV